MKVRDSGRRSRGPEQQLGLLWGGVTLSLIALSPLAARLAGALPGCPSKVILGSPCPTCGISRSAIALADLEPWMAFAINPLATLGWIALIVGGLYAGIASLFGSGITEPDWRLGLGWRVLIVAVVVLNWVYLVRAGI